MANGSREWMWSEAMEMLARAERMHRRMFQPLTPARGRPTWEPPVDMFETPRQVLILTALPGVDPEQVEAVIDQGCLIISGWRTLPPELQTATIHRMELPQGAFERRIPLPPGRYGKVRSAAQHGCLAISLEKRPPQMRPTETNS
jgi:HSP20 family molecular chaperone IbpA